jgi:maleylacetoacetate isomerase (EC 5.2.1.2)
MSLLLYSYWRSSAAYRVRIGLNLKGVDYRQEAINLAPAVSAQRAPTFRQINPQGRVPALATPDGLITQSGAILDWLEEVYRPQAFCRPDGSSGRACG